MYKILAIMLAACLLKSTTAYCCFRDAYMLPSCGCADIDTCGVFTGPCSSCGVSGSCLRDLCDVCNVCDNPSPVCSCLSSIGDQCGCGGMLGCGCGNQKSMIYFPEVEYPTVAYDIKPFYFGSCFNV